MKRMVLGFAFNPLDNTVLLILKARPDWQAGKLNGVGGKRECDGALGWEDPFMAMAREFHEETGCATPDFCWDRVGRMIRDDPKEPWDIDVFKTEGCVWPDLNLNQTDEPLEWAKVDTLTALAQQGACLENIPVLVALCLLPPAAPSNRRPDFVLRY